MALFTATELGSYLRYPVDENDSKTAERAASGWLLNAIGLRAWPDWPNEQTPETLWALAVELGGIIYENPTALASEGLGQSSTSWSHRRAEIADEARRWARLYGLPVQQDVAPMPRGGFPAASGWPDPAAFEATGKRRTSW